MKIASRIISILFHPMLIVSYGLLLLLLLNPYLFVVQDYKVKMLLIFSVVSLTLLFPLLATLMMKGLGLIQSLEMDDKKERIGPMIVSAVFYMWLFANFRSNSFVPEAFKFFVLGSTISLSLAFVLNTQTKISLHTVGMGGLLTGFILIRYFYLYETFVVNFLGNVYQVQTNIVLLLIIIAAGLVGSARLLLGAHNPDQIYGGYFIGMISMLLAFRFIVL